MTNRPLIGVTGPALEDLPAIREIVGPQGALALPDVPDPAAVGALLGAGPRDDFSPYPHLAWVHSAAAGVDGWIGAGGLPSTVTLTSAVGNGAVPMAEHALMLMLMLNRQAVQWVRAQDRHAWERRTHGELSGRSLGIIGYGNSGRDLAAKARACHMEVAALRRRDTGPSEGDVRLLHGEEGLADLLSTSDVVVVTAPLTEATRGLIGAQELALMKPDAFLIVISRGGIVEEDALVAALQRGELAGAGLDAHATEPLPADSVLWDLPGVIITPHNAATTTATAARGREIMLDNVRRWRDGEPLVNQVDQLHGY